MEKKGFAKEESLALKGIGILLMIFHHCYLASWMYEGFAVNFFPLTEAQVNHIAVFCNICLSIFAFISGYELSKAFARGNEDPTSFSIRRYVKFMRAFWPVFVICLVVGAIIDGRTFSTYFVGSPFEWIKNLVFEATGVSYIFGTQMFVHEWWYLGAMVLYIFLTPVLFMLVQKCGWLVPTILWITVPRLLGVTLSPIFVFVLPLFGGIIFERKSVFERLPQLCWPNKTIKVAFGLAGLALTYKIYHWSLGGAYDEFHAAVLPILFIICVKEGLLWIEPICRTLCFLGKHSANMYFIHTVFLTYYLRNFLFSFSEHWFLLTPLAVCAVSLGFSLVLEAGKSGAINKIFGKSNFLSQKSPNSSWTRKQRNSFWMWNLSWVLASGLMLGIFALLLAPGPGNSDIVKNLFRDVQVLALNVLPILFLNLILYALVRRAWAAFSINAVIVLGFSTVNYFKLMIRDDPLMFADLFLFKEARNIVGNGNYKLSLDARLTGIFICVIAIAAFLYFLVRGRPQRVGMLSGTTLLAGILGLALLTPKLMDVELYQKINAEKWVPTRDYVSHGFVYPFIHSITDVIETPPPGYNEEETALLLDAYPEADIPDEKKVNVIAVMLEAYNDFSKFDVPGLSPDVYEAWRDLEEEGYSGDLVTNIFGGGTVDTERCFLTGYQKVDNFRSNVNAYPWYFRAQGYRVEGFHPYYPWFYNRENINSYFGFENYYFNDNLTSFATDVTDPFSSDEVLFTEILKGYRRSVAKGWPYFNYSLSYQGHGSYGSERYAWGERGSFVADDGTYTDTQHCMLENYFGSIASTNESLRKFTDSLRADTEPVVLILFGDHNPALGTDLYSALGINLDTSTEEGFRNYYGTRYIIWANDAAKEILGNDFRGEGPAIGPYFLMNQVFELCGWKGPSYLQAVEPVLDKIQVAHTTGNYYTDGVFTDELNIEDAAAFNVYQSLEYYQRREFRYKDVVSSSTMGSLGKRIPSTHTHKNWHDDPIVAHALGTVDGRVGTNSKEAFIESYGRGMRTFEVDLQLTSDGYLIARHDWEQISYYNLEQDFVGVMDLETFLNTPICFHYTPLSVDDLVSLLEEYPDMYLITDSKDTDEYTVRTQMRALREAVERTENLDLWDRIIIQIYHEEMYEWVEEEAPVTNWIFTLYQIVNPNYDGIGAFCKEHGIDVVTLASERATPEHYETLQKYGCLVYAHTVNRLIAM